MWEGNVEQQALMLQAIWVEPQLEEAMKWLESGGFAGESKTAAVRRKVVSALGKSAALLNSSQEKETAGVGPKVLSMGLQNLEQGEYTEAARQLSLTQKKGGKRNRLFNSAVKIAQQRVEGVRPDLTPNPIHWAEPKVSHCLAVHACITP
jgi:hypothetical protein